MSLLPTIKALGTSWWIEVFDTISKDKQQVIYDDLLFCIQSFETKYSRFNPDSLISTLNAARALLKPDQETIELLEYGLHLYHETHEVFNFLIGEHMVKNGYDALYSFTPKEDDLTTPDPITALSIKPDKIILTLGHVDIGGYGKGYLIDILAARLTDKHGVKEFLINGGGDMYGTAENGKPITIYLEHPTIPQTFIAETTLFYEGFAASSTHKRRWERGGKVYTHIVDSKTGESSTNSLGIFIKAPTARAADAWATTLLLSAPENHIEALERGHIKVAAYYVQQHAFKQYGAF